MIDGMLKVSEISEFLGVKETTAKKWFAGKTDYHRDMAFVGFEEFLEFLLEYRNGYYTKKLIERYEIDEGDDECYEGVRQLLQIILTNCRLFTDIRALGDCDDEILKVIKPKGLEATIVFM